MKQRKSNSLLLAYYGDDFTGSTDVLESLARAGLRTVLFLSPPRPRQLARFPGLRAFGIAGGSRTMSPAQMDRNLPHAFIALKASGASFIHYKTCSTFDSSPTVGSIGKAIELGRRVFGNHPTPLVVGVPVLGRHVVFGNLFARSGLDAEPVRLDRHPTMSRHPVTPMDEADIRVHLGEQTRLAVELVDLLKLKAARSGTENTKAAKNVARQRLIQNLLTFATKNPIVLFDTFDESDLPVIGRMIVQQAPKRGQLFCAGSSGIEYSLIAFWRETGLLGDGLKLSPSVCPAAQSSPSQIVAVSGSCSPVTDRQIARAVEAGFVEIACDSGRLADRKHTMRAVTNALTRAQWALEAGKNVIFQTARGPTDPRRAGFNRAAKRGLARTRSGQSAVAGETLGRGLAYILEEALRTSGSRRAVVCGGDTSTAVARALGIEALEFVAPVAPGGPLCRIHAPGRIAHGCEIVFKGGQVGHDSFFPDLLILKAT